MWNSFKDEMLEYADSLKAQYPTATIGITGHSLGGALATLAAYDTKIKFFDVDVHLHNMGSPRVGNTAFYKKMNELY